ILSTISNYWQPDSVGEIQTQIIKYNSLGVPLWSNEFGCENFDMIPLDLVKNNNRYYVTGKKIERLSGKESFFLRCLDIQGKEVYTKVYEIVNSGNYTNNIFGISINNLLIVHNTHKGVFLANVNQFGEN
ncbi:MAG TPA: hypothetical protein PJ990_17050, partial [Saprospiraceae bacterium]|nr:hypothetical protein [Saprospiraceae bacterium]